MITLANSALAYARRGRRVFPLAIGDKIPKIAKLDGGNGVLDATSEAKQIAEWWRRWPNANIGLALEPHELVIDCDVRKNGCEKLAELEEKYAQIEYTPTQWTATKGLHIFVQRPAVDLRKTLVDGIDLLVGNKYIVAAPSIRQVDGVLRRYEFAIRLSLRCSARALPAMDY